MTSSTAEEPSTDNPQDATLWRGPAAELEALRVWASIHDRSLAEELRLAVRVHLHSLMLGWAASERGEADLRSQGLEPAKEIKETSERLRRLSEAVYTPPPAPKSPPMP